jgi:signal transduction histidine kinase
VADAARAGAAFDAALLDLSLPDAQGVDTVARLCAAAPGLPVVVLTGLVDDAVAARAVHAGAQDYLVKGVDDPRTVGRALRYAVERQALAGANARLLDDARRAVAARDDVLGVVSHDLRTPLSTVGMAARALREQPGADPRHLGAVIGDAAAWALRIVRDLLDVTAIEAGRLGVHPEPMTVAAVLERVVALSAPAAGERGVHLAVDQAPDVRWVDADVDRLVQALGNLVANAIRFSEVGGTVLVAADRVAGSVDGGGAGVGFRVTDHGPGIPPDQLPHVFDRFWQARPTRQGGAGLGLAIAKGIAEGHGGRLEVQTVPGRGTTFTFVLPDAAPAGGVHTEPRTTAG